MSAADALLPHAARTVRNVMRRNDDASEALASVAADARQAWTLAEWNAELARLNACSSTVADWLALND